MPVPRSGAFDGVQPALTVALECPSDMDGLVSELVARFLGDFFAARRGTTTSIDAIFDAEVVERLERFTLTGGKRMRPLFAWWGWRAAGGASGGTQAAAALHAAAALELLQTCALVQDDVMDGSSQRRGRPALHTEYAAAHQSAAWCGSAGRYGDSVAVLAGDLALAWADDMLDDALDGTGARTRVREPWRAMRAEMIAGQYLDLRAQARADESETNALHVDRVKTAAYSVERPLHFGAALAGAGDTIVSALRGFGSDIGTAYQLRDDLIGLYGDPDLTGKPTGDDLREGKRTLLMAIGLRRARARGEHDTVGALHAAMGDPHLTDDDTRAIGALLDGLGAYEAVEEHIDALLESGLRWIADAPIDAAARRVLGELALKATWRRR